MSEPDSVPRARAVRATCSPKFQASVQTSRSSGEVPSHQTTGRYERARHRRTARSPIPSKVLYILLLLCFVCGSAAAGVYDQRRATRKGELLVDRSDPPEPRMRVLPRAASDGDATSSARQTITFSVASSATTLTIPSTTAQTATSAAATASSSALPQPFDTSLGSNFTNSNCPTFFDRFLGNSTFQSCLPFSLLLEVDAPMKFKTYQS